MKTCEDSGFEIESRSEMGVKCIIIIMHGDFLTLCMEEMLLTNYFCGDSPCQNRGLLTEAEITLPSIQNPS